MFARSDTYIGKVASERQGMFAQVRLCSRANMSDQERTLFLLALQPQAVFLTGQLILIGSPDVDDC